jgi:hypothetical protein
MKILLPTHVCHCDWGKAPKKRWLACAVRHSDGQFRASVPSQIGDPTVLISSKLLEIDTSGCAVMGFDFPIGLPALYAHENRISDFKTFALNLGNPESSSFFKVAEVPSEISFRRPFYPYRPGKTKQEHLVTALNVKEFDELRRICEKATIRRKAACPLFWTLGANQVGKAALSGWKDAIIPAMKKYPHAVRLWPFDGPFQALLTPGSVVIAETYPAEYYPWLFEAALKGKGKQSVRKAAGIALIKWAKKRRVSLDEPLIAMIQNGFPEGDDAFDASVGLFGILEVVLGWRESGDPLDDQRSKVEGWILGQLNESSCE